jgi:ferredoxin-2, mitochondrial
MRRWLSGRYALPRPSVAIVPALSSSTAYYSTPGKVKMHVKTRDGTHRDVYAPVGMSLMEVLRDIAKLDVAGSCDGRMECGTCHVYLSDASLEKVSAASEREEDLLAKVLEVRETSRLSCQVVLTAELDGLEVELPNYSSDV